ncbi:unnamed protein product [Adineta steineri]|uniref:Uncharacterized protein n=1 Tax=Adineta steineri TaxID=433720 RepID=A0A815FLQ8_9BILA|nr:unnamed protein product [Adineta steineri]CAF1588515.1 unnamed protein product [Adineta steineri]
MYILVTIFSFIIFHFIHSTSLLSECQLTTTIWTYYPCSFIISSSSVCQQSSINLSIDQCINREVMFFWHFPSGNMTITLESEQNQPFLLRLFKISLSKRQLIKHIYHLLNNQTIEERILDDTITEDITVSSDKYNQCSIKFETLNEMIFEYGTFIQMIIMTDELNNY